MSADPFSLDGKRILVTGASSGIGRQVAISCADRGAAVVLSGRDTARLEETRAALVTGDHRIIAADLTDTVASHALADTVGALQGLVHCAGCAEIAPLRLASDKHVQNTLAVNYIAPITLTRRLLQRKAIAPDSALVYLTATAAHLSPTATSVYAGSKAALLSTLRALALELGKQRIRVNCIAPGYVKTPMYERLNAVSSFDENLAYFPLGLGVPDDVANAAVFLLARASRWITRTSLVVDGGHSLHLSY